MHNFKRQYLFNTLVTMDYDRLTEDEKAFANDFILNEELTPSQKKKVDTWDRPDSVTKKFSSEFNSDGRLVVPLERVSNPPDSVKDHLEKHGYDIHDYFNGKAKDSYGRETSIGKALTKTKAPQDVINTFANDPSRHSSSKASSVSGMDVVLTHNKHDVAGMTSQGHEWAGDSCMNFEEGCNRKFLPHEVASGTHVAYLVHSGDDKAQDPVARVAIKPYHAYEPGSTNPEPVHTIFRADRDGYGDISGDFMHTIDKHMQRLYPAIPNRTYSRNATSYQNTMDTVGEYDKGHITKNIHQMMEKGYSDDTNFEPGELPFTGEHMRHMMNAIKSYSGPHSPADSKVVLNSIIDSRHWEDVNENNPTKIALHNTLWDHARENGLSHISTKGYVMGKDSKHLTFENAKHAYVTGDSQILRSYPDAHKLVDMDKADAGTLSKFKPGVLNDDHVTKILNTIGDDKHHHSISLSGASDIIREYPLKESHVEQIRNHISNPYSPIHTSYTAPIVGSPHIPVEDKLAAIDKGSNIHDDKRRRMAYFADGEIKPEHLPLMGHAMKIGLLGSTNTSHEVHMALSKEARGEPNPNNISLNNIHEQISRSMNGWLAKVRSRFNINDIVDHAIQPHKTPRDMMDALESISHPAMGKYENKETRINAAKRIDAAWGQRLADGADPYHNPQAKSHVDRINSEE